MQNLFLGGGRSQLFCEILSTASPKKGVRVPRSRQKWSEMPGFCLLLPSKRSRAAPEVDKNGVKCPNFVYRSLQKGRARPSK